jgi:RNA polymerase sigma-70 factor, ECF subfamily
VNSDDRRLIAACLAGRTAEFNSLVLRYQDRLFNSVLRVVQNPDDAADVVQESFINAFQSLKAFKGDSEFFTWLYRIAFNAAISQKRKRRPVRPLESADGEWAVQPADESHGIDPGDRLARQERDRQLYDAMAKLTDDHRTALVLRDIDDLSYEQMAEVLGVPIGTVRSRLNRARLELRERLEEMGD